MTIVPNVSAEKDVRKWMAEHVTDYIDGRTNEVNCTALAEAACQEFDSYGPPPGYDCPEEYFDWAVDTENEHFGMPSLKEGYQ